MSFDFIVEPSVRSPSDAQPRRGRGFSRTEVEQAGLTVKDARNMGLLVDLRRRTTHQENIDALIQYSKDLQAFIKKLEAIEEPTSAMLEAVSLLSTLKTVKKSDAEKLVAAGILTIEDLAYCELDKVTKKTGIDEDTLTVMIKDALKKV